MPVGDYIFQKVAEDAPNRCQSTAGQQGQCRMARVDGSLYCPSHGGNKALKAANEKKKFEYRASIFTSRIKDAAESSNIKDMRQEVGVLKMIIEERLASCSNTSELLIQAGPVGDLTVKMQKLIEQITRYDIACGNTLDKQQLIQFAQNFVVIATRYISDEEDRIKFSAEIMDSLNQQPQLASPTPIQFEDDNDE